MSKKSRFPTLKQEIREREAASREIRKKIQGSAGLDRYQHWIDKRNYGGYTRDLLLFYAFMRKVPYRVVEPTCRDLSHGPLIYGLQYCAKDHGIELEKEAIKEWFNVKALVGVEPLVVEQTRGAA